MLPADKARARAQHAEDTGQLLSIRPSVTNDELWDACRVLQDHGWAGGITMGNAIRALCGKKCCA